MTGSRREAQVLENAERLGKKTTFNQSRERFKQRREHSCRTQSPEEYQAPLLSHKVEH